MIVLILSFSSLQIQAGFLTKGFSEENEKLGNFRKDGWLEFVKNDGTVCASIAIEIAETPTNQAIGLMGRTEMDDSVGMLFIFAKADLRVFWMRNTPLSLDIIFISEDSKVINIAKSTQPLSDTRYPSQGLAKYVVEVLEGFSDRYGIEKGIKVRWKRY
jgi:uncharacterized membrane protein (UPF0127 family)